MRRDTSSSKTYCNEKELKTKGHKCKKVHCTNVESSDSEFHESDELSCNTICSLSAKESLYSVTVHIGNVKVEMDIDICADVSVIPHSLFLQKFPDAELLPFESNLTTYNGGALEVVGKLPVNVKYENVCYANLNLVALKTPHSKRALFGRDWLGKIQINWSKIAHKKASQGVNVVKKKKLSIKSDFRIKNVEQHDEIKAKLQQDFHSVFDKT